MARVASFFRWLILAVWSVLVVPFISRAWNGVMDRTDVANHPWDALMNWLASFAQAPGVSVCTLVATGILLGAWSDWLFRKLDGTRAESRETLGYKYCNLASSIEDRLRYIHPSWPHNVHDLKPDLMSAFIRAESFGIWAPVNDLYERPDGGAIMVNYLRIVGTMLKDGHFRQARLRAQQAKTFVPPASTPATSF